MSYDETSPIMDISKFNRLRQIQILKPCTENWESMDGDTQQRFCDKCVRQVHNISEMDAADVEALLHSPERVCTRLTVDSERGILTRSGWIPRALLAGAVASMVTGCQTNTGEAACPPEAPKSAQKATQVKSFNPPDLTRVEKKQETYVFFGETGSISAETEVKPKIKKSLK